MKKEHSELVKEHFELKYSDYDELIRNLIPRYEEMHKLVVDSLPSSKDAKLRILDLGIGTGQTALKTLEKFPNACIDGIDISRKMIEQGKERLKKYFSRVTFFESDITGFQFTKKYDAAIAVLCIHHLNSKQKQQFFSRVYRSLKEKGIFIIADIVKFDTEKETREKEQEWKKFLIKNLGEKEGNYWFENYQQEDLPDSTKNQLKWLEAAGFDDVTCIWEHINYAVIIAKK